MRVMPQNGGGNCGFHMFFNAKCLVAAILAETQHEQFLSLLSITSTRKFWQFLHKCLGSLLKAKSHLVPESDKRSLRRMGPLDRQNLEWLMLNDRHLKQ